ncbi:MAG: hypothetical protein RL172_986 [Bacteroidota bacterium]|jgi:hypothetical protein
MKRLMVGLLLLLCAATGRAQSKAINSVILNFGSNNCGNKTAVSFSSIGNPLSTPFLMSSCSVNPPFSDVFSKFIAYNPKDNKIYINDIGSNDSKLYVYNMGLPDSFTCPSPMPVTPTFNYLYVPNNFEFDINGDLWSIRNLKDSSAIIERIDEATGTILFAKIVKFPFNLAPNTLTSGDIVIIPNGRMFIVMGNKPCRFYEITNYNTAIGSARAEYIRDMPKPCYGIQFLNGTIEMTGTNFGSSCYRYVYDILTRVTSGEQQFQLNHTPVDNSSITPATGLSKRLLGNSNIDSVTEDLAYEIYARNMGNVRLLNFNITEDLGAVFGAGNVSAVNVILLPGGNPCGLVLNPAFDGVTNTKLFNDNQTLSNLQNGYVYLQVHFRATNLIRNKIYYNTAFSKGEIGNIGSRIPVIDSSNNGGANAIDMQSDGDAGDAVDNRPTPYYFGMLLPIKFISIKAARVSKGLNSITWSIAPPPVPVDKFVIEYTEDHTNWQTAGTVAGKEGTTSFYFNHTIGSTENIFYRVKAYEGSGKWYLSTEAVVKKAEADQSIQIFPNPADKMVNITSTDINYTADRRIYIVDVNGKRVADQSFAKKSIDINTTALPSGHYVVNIADKGTVTSLQLVVAHK